MVKLSDYRRLPPEGSVHVTLAFTWPDGRQVSETLPVNIPVADLQPVVDDLMAGLRAQMAAAEG